MGPTDIDGVTQGDRGQEPQESVAIPYAELSADALRGVVESFVLREGTDYGERELSLEEKVADVMRCLEQGEAQIVFDPGTQSVAILPRGESFDLSRGKV